MNNIMINDYINSFNNVDFTNTTDILMWFYSNLNKNIIYTDPILSNKLYNKLIECGYKEIDNPKEELECYKKLMKKEINDEKRIAHSLISLIINKLKNNQIPDMSLESFIRIYNEKYNKEITYNYMLDKLKNNIGTDVVFVVIIDNEIKLLNGKIDNVSINEITISNTNYSLSNISKITSIFGDLLYNNSILSLPKEKQR